MGGIVLAEPIVWLLFERGAFTQMERVKTAQILIMYMIGLIPYGFAKLFSMFLYASHRHRKSAKIASIALVVNILFSFILIRPLGAMGLALAGTFGGWTLFILTIKEVGFERFIKIIKSPKSIYFTLFLIVITILLIYFTEQIDSYINT